MSDFFNFRSMVAPMILKLFFAILFFGVVGLGAYMTVNPMATGTPPWVGVMVILFGWVPVRVVFELAMLNFSIHSELVKISNKP